MLDPSRSLRLRIRRGARGCTASLCLALAIGTSAHAQDSTSSTPGTSDALPAHNPAKQSASYVVDLAPLTSSWGLPYAVAPILKAPADTDPLFTTQLAGATSVSASDRAGVTFPPRAYARWSSPGRGVNTPGPNLPPDQIVTLSGYSRQFGVALTGVSPDATSIITALVGQDIADPLRLYVRRTAALCSRPTAAAKDTCTLSLGGVDPDGRVALRADAFNTASPGSIVLDNIVTVDPALRQPAVATISSLAGVNTASEPASTTFIINAGTVTTNPPSLLPGTGSAPIPIIFDLALKYRPNGAPGASSHFSSGIEAHRGNPSLSMLSQLGGVACVASIACSSDTHAPDAVNIFAINASGAVVAARSARPPSPLTAPGGYSTNTLGHARFTHYNNQTLFRGPSGHVALGFDPTTASVCAAAVLTDPDSGDQCVAVVRFTSPAPQWAVAARPGSPVLNAPGGGTVALVTTSSPATFSPPALDRLGNVYFVAVVTPTGGPVTQAFIKGVRRADGGYDLERILQAGQAVTGVNSTRPYTISRLTLADADSISSGTFHAGALLQPQTPGAATSDPASPLAFGGCVVNARITYDNAGTPEPYEAALFIAPRSPPGTCPADLNADGRTNTADLTLLLNAFGQTVPPGTPADINHDGAVNTADLTLLLVAFGCGT